MARDVPATLAADGREGGGGKKIKPCGKMEEAGVQGTLSRPLSLYNLYRHRHLHFGSVIN